MPSFLTKLREIARSQLYSHIVRWDKSGRLLCFVCVQALEEAVLPHYFRHSRYSSFVRQLNMYGFTKKKADKNAAAAFYHPHFSRDHMDLPLIGKKTKKESVLESRIDSLTLEGTQSH